MGLNELSDMSFKEFLKLHSPFEDEKFEFKSDELDLPKIIYSNFDFTGLKIPEQFDWRDKIKMTSVKNQGNCGSCYAFTAVAAIESFIYRKTGKTVELSVQEVIDCAKNHQAYGINGCNGGPTITGIKYFIDHGLSYAIDYPLTGTEGPCRKNETLERYQANFTKLITSYFVFDFDEPSENLLVKQLFLYGPTVVSIDHLHESFMRYSSGIYYEPKCTKDYKRTSHSVLLVGYGSENGNDYWIAKNSMGKSWGENGYFRIARNKNNHCLIAFYAYSIYKEDDCKNCNEWSW
jgi:C1A family cysteine protease